MLMIRVGGRRDEEREQEQEHGVHWECTFEIS